MEINKNQLSPSSFGSTNKSLDMNINKYNTFNINEVYKKENNSFGEKIINDKENNKFVKIDKDKYKRPHGAACRLVGDASCGRGTGL